MLNSGSHTFRTLFVGSYQRTSPLLHATLVKEA
jgi:hypothetical protein